METGLSSEKIEFYRDNGFVQIEQVLTEQELVELREYADEVMTDQPSLSLQVDPQRGAYWKVLNQRVNAWRDHAGIARYTLRQRFADMAALLSGSNAVRLMHDQLLYKMPGDSNPTPWHQDLTYWPINGIGSLSMWIALDDVDANNGCMMFVPKSRNLGRLQPIQFIEPQDIFEFAKGTEIENTQPVIVPMKAGSCTFHDSLTFHYAHPNHTDKPRRVLAIIYLPDGTIYTGKPNPVLDGTDQIAGQPIQGRLYPILSRLNHK